MEITQLAILDTCCPVSVNLVTRWTYGNYYMVINWKNNCRDILKRFSKHNISSYLYFIVEYDKKINKKILNTFNRFYFGLIYINKDKENEKSVNVPKKW